ncbi:MAG: DUF4405 domain-containing protein [Gammaproteobacteria bacterium]|nr:DUF4405 domain-containing protein [Gammaproteobacteria bacterium]
MAQHVWAGYVVGAVVAIRLVWGFIGSKHARFSDFVRSPASTLRHIRDLIGHRAKQYIGHNPAGGAMIVALLISLSGTVFSGLVLYAVEEDAGPLAGWIANSKASKFPVIITSVYADDDEDDHEDEASEEFWEELHEFFANFTLLLVVLHVTGMLYSSYVDRENLVKAMITGRKRSGED